MKDTLGYETDAITETDVREYRQYLNLQKKLKATSINRKMKSVVLFQRFLFKRGICKEEIGLKRVLLKNTIDLDHEVKVVEKQELYRFKRTIEAENNKRDIAIYYLLFGTGIRCSEMVGIEVDDLVLTDRNGKNNYSHVLIRSGKGNKSRKVNLNAAAVTAIKEYLEVRAHDQSNRLLIGQRGPLSRMAINKIMDKYSKKAQLEVRVNPHAARHTFCSQLIKSGVDPKTVALLSGHSSIDIVYRFYVSSNAEDKQRAVDGLQI
ncbi:MULTISPECIES: tyrosine-type recombinase/integrase [unclassified Paenibacillus]|uniref:tyrosine-type recombinase/integrase n=1 Tax=unclassified Paenibacillus TaxID=185978 RepID=UPI001AE8831B|nr:MULTISPECIES: tyrosine-type recombinase/integrase [unclassified Paenibacillus]MBP1153957.1 integrase/recombinase XerC/integrase/recombinase XerD [Paenibacillus sp. PvP091]MBP1170658.1 integrase/recombinase XerC/integrase/recombinase XerD [Paenibacillus sp. PvR098]MBP2441686.1 integrase/recombinase XerC/integrase/recombinase XerD [Paenibacillus sp. PvP052]